MEAGIDYASLNKRHFRTKSFRRLRIESMIVEGMERYDGGKTAVATVTLARMPALGQPTKKTWRISPPLWARRRGWRPP